MSWYSLGSVVSLGVNGSGMMLSLKFPSTHHNQDTQTWEASIWGCTPLRETHVFPSLKNCSPVVSRLTLPPPTQWLPATSLGPASVLPRWPNWGHFSSNQLSQPVHESDPWNPHKLPNASLGSLLLPGSLLPGSYIITHNHYPSLDLGLTTLVSYSSFVLILSLITWNDIPHRKLY